MLNTCHLSPQTHTSPGLAMFGHLSYCPSPSLALWSSSYTSSLASSPPAAILARLAASTRAKAANTSGDMEAERSLYSKLTEKMELRYTSMEPTPPLLPSSPPPPAPPLLPLLLPCSPCCPGRAWQCWPCRALRSWRRWWSCPAWATSSTLSWPVSATSPVTR